MSTEDQGWGEEANGREGHIGRTKKARQLRHKAPHAAWPHPSHNIAHATHSLHRPHSEAESATHLELHALALHKVGRGHAGQVKPRGQRRRHGGSGSRGRKEAHRGHSYLFVCLFVCVCVCVCVWWW